MKKVYFLLLLSFLSFNTFASTWYANSGNANDVLNWWSDATFTGSHPTDFSGTGDTWMMSGSMTTSTPWDVAGTLMLDGASFLPSFNVTIHNSLVMDGASGFVGQDEIEVYVMGYLSVMGTSSFDNPPAYTHVHLASTGSSVSDPQNVLWTSTNSGRYTSFIVEASATVQLLSNVKLPIDLDQHHAINGTLITNNFYVDLASEAIDMNTGATLYTQQVDGVDGALRNGGSYSIAHSTNFIFNGSTTTGAQATGFQMPADIYSGGSVVVNNNAGVTLSQPTMFENGSSLTLNSGTLTLGANDLTMAVAAPLTGTFGASSMIITNGAGRLVKQFAADGFYLYPVGDASANYTPVVANITAGAYGPAASVGVLVANTKAPSNRNMDDYLNRYWSVKTNDITAPSYTLDAVYVPADVAGTEANLSAGTYTGSLPWVKDGAASTSAHSITSGTITSAVADFTGISTAGPSVMMMADPAVCIGSTGTIGVAMGMRDTPFSYSWAPADGLSATVGASVSATPTVTTTYTVTITDGNGFTGTGVTTVTVNQYPVIDTVSAGGSYCAGGSGVHVSLNTSDTGVNYQVYFAGLPVGTAVAGTGTVLDLGADTAAGSYIVTATGAHTGCVDTMYGNAEISIIPVVIPTVSLTSMLGDTLCSGTMTTFQASYTHGGTAPVFHWTKNGANVGVDSMNYSTIPTDGNVFVVKMISNEVCAIPDSVTDTLVMSVLPNGTPTAVITSDLGTTVCDGSTVTLTATPTFGGYEPSYTWVKNTLTVSASSSYTYMPSNGDHIFAILNSDYRCRLANTAYSNVINMDVVTPVVPYVTIAATPGLFIASGTPDTLVATVYNGGTAPSYQWYLNNAAVPAATSSTFYRSSYNNNDSVSCKVTRNDACGLSSINSVVFKVHPVATAVINGVASDITLTPNPNKGTFSLNGSFGTTDNQPVVISISNMLGQVVYKATTQAVAGQISEQIAAENILTNGIYILNLQSGSTSSTFRFVVEK